MEKPWRVFDRAVTTVALSALRATRDNRAGPDARYTDTRLAENVREVRLGRRTRVITASAFMDGRLKPILVWLLQLSKRLQRCQIICPCSLGLCKKACSNDRKDRQCSKAGRPIRLEIQSKLKIMQSRSVVTPDVFHLQVLSNPGSILAPIRLYFAVAVTSAEVQPKFRNFRLPYRKRPWVTSGACLIRYFEKVKSIVSIALLLQCISDHSMKSSHWVNACQPSTHDFIRRSQ